MAFIILTGNTDMKIKHLILAFLLSSVMQLNGQDFHNSFFQFAPMNINPALTGAFYGNLRANVIARDQGRTVAGAGNEWQDLSIALDYNLDFGLTEGDWVSVGVNMARSGSAGVGDFRRQFGGLNLAYHLAFGKKKDKVFTVGAKYGNYSTGFKNPNTVEYNDPETLSGGFSQDIAGWMQNLFGNGPDPQTKSSGDYMVGLMLDAPLGKTADIRIGIASDHILQPRLSTSRDTTTSPGPNPIPPGPIFNEDLNRRINAFVFLYTDINSKLTFNPNILFQKSGVSTNIVVQALFNYLYSKEKDISFIVGLGARFVNDMDLPIYLALDMKTLRVGLSYDTNIGGLRPSSGTFGALELGITKVFNWNKKTVVQPKFICPRL